MKTRIATGILYLLTSTAGAAATADISAQDLGTAWPLMIASGTLACRSDFSAPMTQLLTITDQAGNTYPLNGAASSRARQRGWFALESIWKANPAIPGTKIPITPLIQRAQALCDPKG